MPTVLDYTVLLSTAEQCLSVAQEKLVICAGSQDWSGNARVPKAVDAMQVGMPDAKLEIESCLMPDASLHSVYRIYHAKACCIGSQIAKHTWFQSKSVGCAAIESASSNILMSVCRQVSDYACKGCNWSSNIGHFLA